jgi:hypothetical protein
MPEHLVRTTLPKFVRACIVRRLEARRGLGRPLRWVTLWATRAEGPCRMRLYSTSNSTCGPVLGTTSMLRMCSPCIQPTLYPKAPGRAAIDCKRFPLDRTPTPQGVVKSVVRQTVAVVTGPEKKKGNHHAPHSWRFRTRTRHKRQSIGSYDVIGNCPACQVFGAANVHSSRNGNTPGPLSQLGPAGTALAVGMMPVSRSFVFKWPGPGGNNEPCTVPFGTTRPR